MKREKPDAAARKISRLLPESIGYLNAGAPKHRPPAWVEDLQENPREIHFRGRDGAVLLDEWRAQTEAEMKAILEREEWGLLRVLGTLRRLPMDQIFLGERPGEGAPRSFDRYLANVAEYAALRYAARDDRGTKLEPWRKGPSGFARDVPEVERGSLAQLVALASLTGPHFGHLDNVRKTLARGGEATLRLDGVMDTTRQRPELLRRLRLHEQRLQRFYFYGSTAGTYHPPGAQDDPLGSLTYFWRAAWREDEGGQPWRYEYSERWIPKREKRFLIDQIPLRPLYEYLHLLEDVVVERYGLAPEVIVAGLMSVERLLWIFLSAGPDHASFEADRLISLDRTGYLLVEEEGFDTAILGRLIHQAHQHAFPGVPLENNPSSLAHGFKRLAYLDSYRAEDVSLEDGQPWVRGPGDTLPTPMPRPFVYPAGPSARVVDLCALGQFVSGLYGCLAPPQKAGQLVSKDYELRLGEYLGEYLADHRAFPPRKELWRKVSDGRKERVAELDVSFRIGTVLVIVDAKSIPISPGYHRYQYGALKRRWEKFAGDDKKNKGYVKEADEQAKKLARHPRGTNYDLLVAGYTHVVTLLCTTLPEYVDTDDPKFYVREDLPRITAQRELREFLVETDEAELKSLPFAQRIADNGALARVEPGSESRSSGR